MVTIGDGQSHLIARLSNLGEIIEEFPALLRLPVVISLVDE
ncbi:hypothetical protein HMPREF9069_00989 [Atopobium sp. oral taxon 810 str. F0209]|nr:hypothetical protein HMPREF9069_00989 [Atopobium sp. oral taxon 810 str. F0209]